MNDINDNDPVLLHSTVHTPAEPRQERFETRFETRPAAALTEEALGHLLKTRPWVRLFGVLAFIGTGCMVLGGLAMFGIGLLALAAPDAFSMQGTPGVSAAPLVMMGLLYFAFGFLYIPIGLFLNRYAGGITDLEHDRTAASLENALKNQKSFWRYLGILTIVCVIVSVLSAIAVVILAGLGILATISP
ncbi:MAG: DUF5362 family protein [Acidobacteriota bacterium]|nr:DUF5362 family protein [Acidobacteriota bacterium]